MIKSFIFENFKSFEKAELNLEALTRLIGTNSSGKSKAIEGIHILADTATGLELSTILDGTRNMAVSYTNLDVYKRQVMMQFWKFCGNIM